MKKIILIALLVLMTLSLFAQPVKTTCNCDSSALRIKANVDSSCITRVPKDAQIVVIAIANDLYFKVTYKSDTGYMKKYCVIHEFKGKDGYMTNDYELFAKVPDEHPRKKAIPVYYTDATINGAIALYGKENKRSQYQSGSYDSITLVWNCVNGKYRSITYVFNGEYVKESEYVSDCI